MEVTKMDLSGTLRGGCSECLCSQYHRTVCLIQLSPEIPIGACVDCWHRPASHGELERAVENSEYPPACSELAIASTASLDVLGSREQESSSPECSLLPLLEIKTEFEECPISPPPRSLAVASSQDLSSAVVPAVPAAPRQINLPAPQDCRGRWKHGLPPLCSSLNPLLFGEPLDEERRKTLVSKLRDDLIHFLDTNHLVLSGSSATIRWSYNSLGKALASAYPNMVLDKPGAKPFSRSSGIHGPFIRRLACTRKMRRLRALKAKKDPQQTP
ncbi:uncharacterized protein LOC8030368 [Ixodes scapularis]|nr:uncharacterized protein LOC8030368 [Ixodes scapularis]